MTDYDIETPRHIAHGIKVFQAGLVNGNERDTVRAIYDALNPQSDSLILDMGCGIGGVAELMLELDDSLLFLGVTNSRYQVEHITQLHNPSIAAIFSDFSKMPIPDNSVDYIMLNEAIGFGDTDSIFHECSRVLKPNGRVLIKSFNINIEDQALIKKLSKIRGYKPTTIDEFEKLSKKYKFKFDYKTVGNCSGKRWLNFLLNDPYMRVKYEDAKFVKHIENQEIILITLEHYV